MFMLLQKPFQKVLPVCVLNFKQLFIAVLRKCYLQSEIPVRYFVAGRNFLPFEIKCFKRGVTGLIFNATNWLQVFESNFKIHKHCCPNFEVSCDIP